MATTEALADFGALQKDMQLLRAATPSSAEAIAPFSGCAVQAGGSAPNTAAGRTAAAAAAIS